MTTTDAAKRRSRLVAGVSWIASWSPVVMLLLFCLWMVRAGMSVSDLVAALAVVGFTQVLPGLLVWRLVRPREGWWVEDVALGFAVGSVLAILAQVPAGLLDWWWLSAALMLGLSLVIVLVPATRRRVLEARTMPLPMWWGPLVALSSLTVVQQLTAYIRQTPIEWASGFRAVHIDSYLHLALAGQLEHRGPTTFPWVQSESLGYHWFSHAWMAQIGATSGVELETILMRFMPLLVPVIIAVVVAAAAVRLSGKAWAGPAAAWLVMLPGMANPLGVITGRLPATPLSPTLGISVPMLVALVVVIVMRWRGEARTGSWILVPVLALSAAGTKGSTTPLVVAGAGLALVTALLWRRDLLRRIAVDLGLTILGLALAILLVFRGSGAGLHLSLKDAVAQSWAGVVVGGDTVPLQLASATLTVIGAFSLGAVGLATLFFTPNRREPMLYLLAGATLAGSGAPGVFAHPGRSQWYFQLNALPLMALLSVTALALLAGRWSGRQLAGLVGLAVLGAVLITGAPKVLGAVSLGDTGQVALLVGLAVVVLAVVGASAALLGSGARAARAMAAVGLAWVLVGVALQVEAMRRPLPGPAQAIGPRAPLAASRAQIDAARWVRDHSDVDDVVMTNRHCVVPTRRIGGCDSRRWLVTAYSERQVLLEGWTATPRSAEEGPEGRDSITIAYWEPELQQLNDGFIAEPTEEAAADLRRRGVRWVFVDHTQPHAETLEPYAGLRKSFPGVDVYELTG